MYGRCEGSSEKKLVIVAQVFAIVTIITYYNLIIIRL